MKKIIAIVREEKFAVIKDALLDIGYPGMTVTEVKGHGSQKGITEQWRGRTFKTDFVNKIQMEMVVPDKDVKDIIKCILREAATGSIGDGKIFISPIEDAIRIRTGERGEKAI
ncbi:MAG: P-II family nitrogen regulator [Candidatus Jettenia sp.]|uniref:Nitrogen regulatory protein n=2 Tax=Candidatus Jettenia TaxID=360731 RepID=I3IL30_9BACT|nr:P-II family nitrogen regulator [Candidatus Jettenia sp. AMX1]MBC6929305.1 P-II family nitrogen regulator [Candidatus Jettenia sp.]NUN22662.1 P-II family nitrogen regulator [Candidatus Jettenia caeni]TLD41681.1 MAG: Nitrogen regulatory protein P-II [Candidatus Jettenia ecosi]KAA0249679.1 MAG: P-II family nitrogen regulator [Candidatus Jettenia sp. AMX1]MCE7880782.1 P-II family nitrogen regulator [Candidatus Jettenia sp. AMX1]